MKTPSLKRNLNVKKTCKQVFLEEIEQVVPRVTFVELIAPYYPEGKTGRRQYSLQTMLLIHFMQHWLTLSNPDMENAFLGRPFYHEFALLKKFGYRPKECTILYFRYRLEMHKLVGKLLGEVFRVIKHQFGFVKVRYWGLKQIIAQLVIQFETHHLKTTDSLRKMVTSYSEGSIQAAGKRN